MIPSEVQSYYIMLTFNQVIYAHNNAFASLPKRQMAEIHFPRHSIFLE